VNILPDLAEKHLGFSGWSIAMSKPSTGDHFGPFSLLIAGHAPWWQGLGLSTIHIPIKDPME
jgi:hypothetical protein